MSSEGNMKDLYHRCKLAKPEIKTKKEYGKKILGYIGMQIGLLEVLWRRGYLDLDKDIPNETEARHIAKDISDFKHEVSEVEFHIEKLGAGAVFTPKGHCEIARHGIEYAWSVVKILFRKQNTSLSNDARVNSLKERVKELYENLPLSIIQKCCRQAREYKLSYLTLLNDENNDLHLNEIEK